MQEKRAIQLITRKLAGETTPEEEKELQYLLSVDADAAEYFRLCSELWQKDTLPGSGPEAVSAAYARHLQRFGQDFREGDNATRFRTGKIFGIKKRVWYAAASVLVLATTAAVLLWPAPHQRPAATTIAANKIQSGEGRKKLQLPDGSVVWLNKNSRLQFDLDNFATGSRTVYLDGEAYFDVARMKDHPFVIHTPELVVKVLGTAFNVKAYASSATEATLISGAIQLELPQQQVKPIVLKPREKFTLGTCSGCKGHTADSSRVTAVEPVHFLNKEYIEEIAWMNHQLVFRNKTFAQLAADMEQWFGVTIHIQEQAIAQYHFTGAFEQENITDALKALQVIRPFKFIIHQNQVTIF
jgi:ferric-dicitrate binding protein FerR (iron transport regulator)